jgi:hypothetical protein
MTVFLLLLKRNKYDFQLRFFYGMKHLEVPHVSSISSIADTDLSA